MIRPRLGLQWKAIWMIVAVLGVSHLVFSLWSFLQLSSQHERHLREDMAVRPREFDTLLEQAQQSIGELALQLAFVFSNTPDHAREAALAQTENFGSFVSVEFFDAQGQPMAAWDAPGSQRPTSLRKYSESVLFVLTQNRPTSFVSCISECALYALLPAFDNKGNKLVVAVGQPLSETLLAFQSLDEGDVAVLSTATADDATTPGATPMIWDRRLLAVTDAPRLLPLLKQLRQPRLPGEGQIVSAQVGEKHLRLALAPLPRAADAATQLLFIVDETATLDDIRQQSVRSLRFNIVALLASALAIYLLLAPALRRLGDVTRALPLLAEQQFDASREQILAHGTTRHGDEIDVLRDTTLALSRRLEALSKVEAASEEKSRFLATMSHEIRTPMNGILGLLELLETDSLTPDQRDAVRIARDSGRTLLRVIDDILDLSRIEARQIQIEQMPFVLGEVVEDAVETLAPSARSKHLRLCVFVDPTLPLRVIGDPLRLRQVLFNLCSNAIKFTATGSVKVRAEAAAGAPPGQQRVRFRVIDTGIGIAPESRKILFRPFMQADSTTTRRFGGSGLGLSIVRGLVTRMGGVVDYSSVEGSGSDFWFELDLAVAAADAEAQTDVLQLHGVAIKVDLPDRLEAADLDSYLLRAGGSVAAVQAPLRLCEASAPHDRPVWLEIQQGLQVLDRLSRPVRYQDLIRRLRIAAGLQEPALSVRLPTSTQNSQGPWVLVAEDHPVNQQVIQRQLTQIGYRSKLAGDGAEALKRLQEQDFAVLLADLHMPHMDGIELTTRVRAAEAAGQRAGHLPIIIVTAAALSGERERCREAGVDGFLLKPAGLEQLRDALHRFAPIAAASIDPIEPDRADACEAHLEVAEPIDQALLLDLVGGDSSFAEHLLREFLRINGPVLRQLDGLMSAPWDARAIRESAHRLLGSARTIAAIELSGLIERLETHAEQSASAEAMRLWPSVLHAYGRVRLFIESRAGQTPHAGMAKPFPSAARTS